MNLDDLVTDVLLNKKRRGTLKQKIAYDYAVEVIGSKYSASKDKLSILEEWVCKNNLSVSSKSCDFEEDSFESSFDDSKEMIGMYSHLELDILKSSLKGELNHVNIGLASSKQEIKALFFADFVYELVDEEVREQIDTNSNPKTIWYEIVKENISLKEQKKQEVLVSKIYENISGGDMADAVKNCSQLKSYHKINVDLDLSFLEDYVVLDIAKACSVFNVASYVCKELGLEFDYARRDIYVAQDLLEKQDVSLKEQLNRINISGLDFVQIIKRKVDLEKEIEYTERRADELIECVFDYINNSGAKEILRLKISESSTISGVMGDEHLLGLLEEENIYEGDYVGGSIDKSLDNRYGKAILSVNQFELKENIVKLINASILHEKVGNDYSKLTSLRNKLEGIFEEKIKIDYLQNLYSAVELGDLRKTKNILKNYFEKISFDIFYNVSYKLDELALVEFDNLEKAFAVYDCAMVLADAFDLKFNGRNDIILAKKLLADSGGETNLSSKLKEINESNLLDYSEIFAMKEELERRYDGIQKRADRLLSEVRKAELNCLKDYSRQWKKLEIISELYSELGREDLEVKLRKNDMARQIMGFKPEANLENYVKALVFPGYAFLQALNVGIIERESFENFPRENFDFDFSSTDLVKKYNYLGLANFSLYAMLISSALLLMS